MEMERNLQFPKGITHSAKRFLIYFPLILVIFGTIKCYPIYINLVSTKRLLGTWLSRWDWPDIGKRPIALHPL